MTRDPQTLIAALVDDLAPVRSLRPHHGIGLAFAGLAIALLVVSLMLGLRTDLLSLAPHPYFLVGSGSFLLLGGAASIAVVMMGRPNVGSHNDGWAWTAAVVALLPLSAAVLALNGQTDALLSSAANHGVACLIMGSVLGSATFVALIAWLRRGAPTSPERAGLATGVASGSLGIFAYSLHCDYSDLVHIGIWHGGAVLLSAVIGRLLVPRLVRW